MAIMGFLAHTLPEYGAEVEKAVQGVPQLSSYGLHEGCYVVAVADAPASQMEGLLEQVRAFEGVLTCYVTSMHMDDQE